MEVHSFGRSTLTSLEGGNAENPKSQIIFTVTVLSTAATSLQGSLFSLPRVTAVDRFDCLSILGGVLSISLVKTSKDAARLTNVNTWDHFSCYFSVRILALNIHIKRAASRTYIRMHTYTLVAHISACTHVSN